MDKKRLFELIVWVLFGAFLLLGVYNQISVRQKTTDYLQDAAKRFENKLKEADQTFQKWLKRSEHLKDAPFEAWYALEQDFPMTEEVVVWENDSLIYWSGTRLTIEDIKGLRPGFVVLKNLIGYHFVKESKNRRQSYVLKLKNNYEEENQYLKNELFNAIDGGDDIRLLDKSENGTAVKDPSGATAFKIGLAYNQRTINLTSRERSSARYFIMSIALAILLFFLRLEFAVIANRPWYSLFEFALPLIVIRVLLFTYRDSIGLSSLELFDPKIFASHWLLPSFGDLLLHLLLLILPLAFLFRYRVIYHRCVLQIGGLFRQPLIIFIANTFFILLFLVSLLISRDLVFSSDIPIGLEFIFDFNGYTYLAIFTYLIFIGMNAASFYLHFKYILKNISTGKTTVLLLLTALFIYWLFSFTGEVVWLKLYWRWWVFLLFCLLFLHAFSSIKWRFGFYFNVLIALWSLFLGYQVSEALYRKQIENARYTARKIFAPNDPTAIYLLLDLIPKMQQDEEIKDYKIKNTTSPNSLQNRLQYVYLKGYLEKYSLQDAVILAGQALEEHQINGFKEDLQQIDRFSMLRQFKQNARQGYSLRVPFQSDRNHIDTLVLRLVQKSLKPDSPFPGLLVEGDFVQRRTFNSFSFALYENGLLIQQGGKYPYQLVSSSWVGISDEYSLLEIDNLSHFIYKPDEFNIIVVSFGSSGWIRALALSSGLFLLMILLLFLFNRLANTQFNWQLFFRLNYRNRIEIALIGSVLTIMVVIGYVTITYTVLRSRGNTEELVTSRLQDIQAAVEVILRSKQGGMSLGFREDYQLNQVAANLSADFSIYGSDGLVKYSTQEKLFERNLLSELAQPDAFYQVVRLQQTVYLQNEKVGQFAFKSAYVPLRDSKGELMGMLNMPSFDTDVLEKAELNEFVGNLLSLYFIMLLLAGVIVLVLAERITSPIKLLTEVILKTKAGMRNQMPAWKRDDEIGALISSYNNMVEELDQSAKLLARSERESAWREMARQIAHEIRNPLTPMKLKLQRMLRDYAENPTRFSERFRSEALLVLEQIDVLAAVAGEFSSFAQVQVGEKQPFDLRMNLFSVLGLYEQQMSISFEDDLAGLPVMPYSEAVLNEVQDWPPCISYGDALQVQRVFQNLLKNAMQSVPEDRHPEIQIRLYRVDSYFAIDFIDNGNGISIENRERIFQPNFTTKSSGMGLGLAIVKKIIEQNEGNIGFETTEGLGTRFYVQFPVHQDS
ncbi:MAG: ATP-binding protein [Sphingobacteriaceae bacterium]|nr:ATP-binding protein [Sphingobacteriaceae bacterium]